MQHYITLNNEGTIVGRITKNKIEDYFLEVLLFYLSLVFRKKRDTIIVHVFFNQIDNSKLSELKD